MAQTHRQSSLSKDAALEAKSLLSYSESAVGRLKERRCASGGGNTTTKPRVSVVIPAYNLARFLAEALDSVFAQTVSPHEVIVVDDGSADDTQRVLEPYHDRICVLHQKNAGVAAARNRGAEHASGELLHFWTPTIYGSHPS
jgi:cellulose synthase/poly-beta-1,6-N-acetylglucosamine synthase-like glycosyltransferase